MIQEHVVNLYLELINGVIVILLLIVLAFFAYYLNDLRKDHKLSWWKFMINPLPGVMLAQPMISIKVGVLIASSTVLIWRHYQDGHKMMPWQFDLVVLGAGIIFLSLLWLIRVISHACFGEWPWFVGLCTVSVYVVSTLLIHM